MPDLPPRQLAASAAAVLALVVLVGWYLGCGGGSPGAAPAGAPAISVEREDDAAELTVHVAGAVRRPGVYRLEPGSRVDDAVERAGRAGART